MMLKHLAVHRWVAHGDIQAAVDYVKALLIAPESDGISKLERIYRGSDFENQRNHAVETFALTVLGKRFKGDYISFQADCAPDGRCRFHLRVARSHGELAAMPPAHADHFMNMLSPREDWIVGPDMQMPAKAQRAPMAQPPKARPKLPRRI
jgi:hypothetical protein